MKKQILALLGVGTLAYGSANLSFTDLQAANITAPSTWTYRYDRYANPTFGFDWFFEKNGISQLFDPLYSLTNSTYEMVISPVIYSSLREGLQINISIDGNSSNSFWSSSGALYYPNGNLNTTNGIIKTAFYNNSFYDYQIWFDYSLSSTGHFNLIQYHNNGLESFNAIYNYGYNTSGMYFYVPSNSGIEISTIYGYSPVFSALYLREIGLSQAVIQGNEIGYENGYDTGIQDGYDIGYDQGEAVGLEQGYPVGFSDGFDAGFSDGIIIAPIGVLFQAAFGAVASIFNIQVLGNLTLGSIIIAPIAVALLWFILGIVSGVGVGGKKK
jgi:hypothetical protein